MITDVKIKRSDVEDIFSRSKDQSEALVGIYKLVLPFWDGIESIKGSGWPVVSGVGAQQLMKMFIEFDQAHHPEVMAGGLWMNKGFSNDSGIRDYGNDDEWRVSLDGLVLQMKTETLPSGADTGIAWNLRGESLNLDDVVANIRTVLNEARDGDFIAKIFSSVSSVNTVYIGDSLFEKEFPGEIATCTPDEIIEDITDILGEAPVKTVIDTYNEVCSDRLAYYNGKSLRFMKESDPADFPWLIREDDCEAGPGKILQFRYGDEDSAKRDAEMLSVATGLGHWAYHCDDPMLKIASEASAGPSMAGM